MRTFAHVESGTRDVMLVEAPVHHLHLAFDRSVAVVMGVNAYARGIPQLKTAVHDAEAIGTLLEREHGFTKLLLRDGEVTCERIRTIFTNKLRDELGGELSERDRLIVYFAGHGLSLPSNHGPEGQLLLADADPGDPTTFLAMSELRKLIGELTCRHVLIVLDCCFAGTFRWAGNRVERGANGPAYRETLKRFVKHRAWQVLVSASHDQTALDAMSTRHASDSLSPAVVGALGVRRIELGSHSPFAAALLRALQGAADYTKDGLIVAAELELFVRDAVELTTSIRQTPQLYMLEQHDRGEFVFQVPGVLLDLPQAPTLSLDACPYQGLKPYSLAERNRFYGRARVIRTLIGRVTAKPLTVVIGPSGAGKTSLLAAGLVPALRAMQGWTVIEARPDTTPDVTLRDLIEVRAGGSVDPGHTLLERITAWLSIHVSEQLCLAIDQAEWLEILVTSDMRDRVLGCLAHALEAHAARFRVVLTLRSEFEPVFRASALAPFWNEAVFIVPTLAHHELRDIIERPARALELSFEPASLVDTLIDEVLQAPNGLPLLSVGLRELYVRCAARNSDRLLTEDDYYRMGRLSGALAQRALALLQELVVQDGAYATTARRVFLRLVVQRDGEWSRRRAHRDEFIFTDNAETQRAGILLARFQDAHLIVFDKDEWEPAHEWLVRGWPMFSMWRTQFGAKALKLQCELAEATRRWHARRRTADLWSDDERLRDARMVMRASDSWLNARERAFVATSLRHRKIRICVALATVVLAGIVGISVWDLYYRPHIDYYRDYVRHWGEPEGIDAVTELEAHSRTTTVKTVRQGHLGHIKHVAIVHSGEGLAHTNINAVGSSTELAVNTRTTGERTPCQWDFAYESDMHTVSTETARDGFGRVVYRLQYRGGSRERIKASFLDENGDDARVRRGNAELIEFIRSPQGRDIEKRYTLRNGGAARNQDGITVEQLEYDKKGHITQTKYINQAGQLTRQKDSVAGYRSVFNMRGDEIEVALFNEANKPTQHKDGFAGYWSTFDMYGNEIERVFFDEGRKRTRHKEGAAGYRTTFDARGNPTHVVYLDENLRPTRIKEWIAGHRSIFDEHGNEIERRYLDEAGKPIRSKAGVAGHRSMFDARGNEIERTYLDEAGKPMRSKTGIAGYHSQFDQRGNEIERAFFDEIGNLTRSENGVAGYRSTFDKHDDEWMRTYFGEDRRSARDKNGVAGYRSCYDAHGNEAKREFIDENGKLARNNNGIAERRSQFDQWGNQIKVEYFAEASDPCQLKNGVAVVDMSHGEQDDPN